MAGAGVAGGVIARAEAARAAGCDMMLVCNDPAAVTDLLSRWQPAQSPDLARRCKAMALRAA
jgi:beta-N-acetylhexosaminidase